MQIDQAVMKMLMDKCGTMDLKAAQILPQETQSAVDALTPMTIAFFGHDSSETVVIKRARAFQAAGATVIGFMFQRERLKEQVKPFWSNIPLGFTVDRNYLSRLPKLLTALGTIWRHRGLLRDADVIYARNIDMMALATAGKWLSGSSAQLVYEVLDVQRVFVGTGIVNKLFRWFERRLLSACDLLVVSAPMFITQYFAPMQKYSGNVYLLENKVSAAQLAAASQTVERKPPEGPPWIIGWFGTIRCPKSLEILSRLAAASPELVTVHIRGLLSEEDISREAMLSVTEGRPNIHYFGPYQNPRDLADIYGQIHFTWAIDYLDAGSNSDWLLPNRLYEGGLYNAISIARAGTGTGEMVAREKLGVALPEPMFESVNEWLRQVTMQVYDSLHNSACSAPRTLFVDEHDTAELLRSLASKFHG